MHYKNKVSKIACKYDILLKYFIIVLFIFSQLSSLKSQTLKILPLGNSITLGYTVPELDEEELISYRFRLYNYLNAAGYNFDFIGHKSSGWNIFSDYEHCGIGGTRDEYLVRLLQDGYDLKNSIQITPNSTPYLDIYPPDIILLHIGTNDITHGDGPSAGSVSQILDEIDAWELRTGNEAVVFVARIIKRVPLSDPLNNTTIQFNNNVENMINARNDPDIHIVNMEDALNYSTDMADELHPNEDGYNKMALEWFNALESLNTPPYFTSSPVLQATEGSSYIYNVTTDDDNEQDNLIIYAMVKPDWLTFTDYGDKTGLLIGVPDNDDVGDHFVKLRVYDGKETVDQDFTITVSNVNDPPEITGQSFIQTYEDTELVISLTDINVEDIDNESSDIRLIVLPGDNYTFEDSTIVPVLNYSYDLNVNIKVTDQIDTSNLFPLVVDMIPVNDPPKINSQNNLLETKEEMPITISLNDLVIEDIDNYISDMTLEVFPDTSYTVEITTITPDTGTAGELDVDVRVHDLDTFSNIYTITINVKPKNSPPEINSIPPSEIDEDSSYFYVVQSTDPDDDTMTCSAAILPDWLEFNSSACFLGGVPSKEDTGEHWVALQVTDGTFIVEQVFSIKVNGVSGVSIVTNKIKQSGSGIINNIYPNPAQDFVIIKLNEKTYDINYLLFDITGKIVEEALIVKSENEFHICTSDLLPGVIFFKIYNEEYNEIRKIVISK